MEVILQKTAELWKGEEFSALSPGVLKLAHKVEYSGNFMGCGCNGLGRTQLGLFSSEKCP
jgi:hypothetical protein